MKKKIIIPILVVLVCGFCIGGFFYFNNSSTLAPANVETANNTIDNEVSTTVENEIASVKSVEDIVDKTDTVKVINTIEVNNTTEIVEEVSAKKISQDSRLTDAELDEIAKLPAGVQADDEYKAAVEAAKKDYNAFYDCEDLENYTPAVYNNYTGMLKKLLDAQGDEAPYTYYIGKIEAAKECLQDRIADRNKSVGGGGTSSTSTNPSSGTSSSDTSWLDQYPLTVDGHHWTPEFQRAVSLGEDHLLSLEEYNADYLRSQASSQEHYDWENASPEEKEEAKHVHIH